MFNIQHDNYGINKLSKNLKLTKSSMKKQQKLVRKINKVYLFVIVFVVVIVCEMHSI